MTAIVCPVRKGGRTDTLRYMLRTLDNLDGFNGEIWIVGHKPQWLTNVHFIPGNRGRVKAHNVWSNIRAACNHPDVPNHFILTNDDVFILQPSYIPQVEHLSTLAVQYDALTEQQQRAWFGASLHSTRTYLQTLGITEPLSFEGHKPMPVIKAAMASALNDSVRHESQHTIQARTIYGNVAAPPTVQGPDRKIRDNRRAPAHWPVVSTDSVSWASDTGRYIRRLFDTPSRYEADR